MPSPGTTVDIIKNTLSTKGHAPRSLASGLAMNITASGGAAEGASLVHMRLEVTAPFTLFEGADNANKAGGTKLLDFPAGIIVPLGTSYDLTLSNTLALGETTAGEIGLGTTVATGAVAVLSGNAAFENFATGLTLGDITAGNTLIVAGSVPGSAPIGGPASELGLFLNLATAFSDEASAHSVRVVEGTIDVWYIHTP